MLTSGVSIARKFCTSQGDMRPYFRNLVIPLPSNRLKAMRKIIVMLMLLMPFAIARDKKEYPFAGTVVSFHADNEAGGSFDSTGGSVSTFHRRIYVVKTDSGTVEITGWENGFKAARRPALTVGQTISYRLEKGYVYAVLEDGKEHRFYVMSSTAN
jgi:hypothetical protein